MVIPAPLPADRPSRVKKLADRTLSNKPIQHLGVPKPENSFLSRVVSMPGFLLGKLCHLENTPGI